MTLGGRNLTLIVDSQGQRLKRLVVVFSCLHRVFIVIVVALFVTWLAIDTRTRPNQLISFGGVCVFTLLVFLLSAHRTAVSFAVSQCRYHGDGCFETCSGLILQVIFNLFAETLDIAWPCAPVITESVKVLPCNNYKFYGDSLVQSRSDFLLVFRCHGGLCSGVWGCSSVLAFLS